MPDLNVYETKHFRQCHQTKCLNYGGFIFAEIEYCPLCGERAPYVGEAAKVTVKNIGGEQPPEGDWTHGEGYEKADKTDIGL